MKFFGNANLQQNELQNAVLPLAQSFPNTPKVGQLAFVSNIVYICIQANDPNPPVWIPLTREITTYTHVQNAASSVWTVVHNLNTVAVNIQVYSSANRFILPEEIEVIDPNTAIITFPSDGQLSGRAVVVAGHLDGNVKPTYAYTFYQSESATTWTIDHNLGYHPVVRVFIGVNEVQPTSISHPSLNQTIITFSSNQVGYARLI